MKDNYVELYEKLSRLQWLRQRHRFIEHAGYGPMADPTRGQGRVLAALKMQSEISTKDLSYLLGIRQQSLNELLNKMEKGGYITRTPSEADKRIMIIQLTEKGKKEQQVDRDLGGMFDCLSKDEQVLFGEYIDRVIAALEAQVGDEFDEDMMDWMRAARSRMGNEQFERLMSMRGGGFSSRHGFGQFGKRGGGPDNKPGAERFDPDYNDFIPDERERFRCGKKKEK